MKGKDEYIHGFAEAFEKNNSFQFEPSKKPSVLTHRK